MWTLNFRAGKWKADLHFLSLQVSHKERGSLVSSAPAAFFSLRNERDESITARFPCFSSSTFARIQIFCLYYFILWRSWPPNSVRFEMGTCVFMVPPLSWWDALAFFCLHIFTSSLRTHASVCECAGEWGGGGVHECVKCSRGRVVAR